MLVDRGVVAGNVYDKYASRNPVARLLFGRFLRTVEELCDVCPQEKLFEVGCGEGELLVRLGRVLGGDTSPLVLKEARRRHPHLVVSAQSAYALALRDRSVDLLVACEVLEHLERPEEALCEMRRVLRRRAILSVPREPIWRLLNLARRKYVRELGNTPGHVQHYSRASFLKLVEKHFRIVAVCSPLPWTVVAAELKT